MSNVTYVIEKTKDIVDDAKYYANSPLGGVAFTMSLRSCSKFNSQESAILEIHELFNIRPHLKGKLIVTKIK